MEGVTIFTAIRMGNDGYVDDVAIHGDLFRMEQMDDDAIWVCIYRGKERAAFFINRQGKKLHITTIEDSIGCIDDTKVKP